MEQKMRFNITVEFTTIDMGTFCLCGNLSFSDEEWLRLIAGEQIELENGDLVRLLDY